MPAASNTPPTRTRREFLRGLGCAALGVGVLGGAGAALAGCSDVDPLERSYNNGDPKTIIIGSQDYYSNEVIAEIWAQTLETAGYRVDRQYRIGQREAYLPQITGGGIELFPEYAGPLLAYLAPERATTTELPHVMDALRRALPAGVEALRPAPATDQDAYGVTAEFAERFHLRTVKDLAKVTGPLVFGANSEAAGRPYSADSLAKVIGRPVGFTPIEDSGGPLTLKALQDGDIQIADVYTSDPKAARAGIRILDDDAQLFLPANIVPLIRRDLEPQARRAIEEVTAKLSTPELIRLNARSVEQQVPSEIIAGEWLASVRG